MRDGWQLRSLSQVCAIRPPKSEARRRVEADADVSFLPMEDLGSGSKFVTPIKTKSLAEVAGSYTYFADGDVLLPKISPCFENGKLGIATRLRNGVGFGSSEYIVLRPSDAVSSEWLYYFLSRSELRDEGTRLTYGTVGQRRVPKEFISDYPIPVPPLDEQQSIVAVLDETFGGIAVAEANAIKSLRSAYAIFESSLHSRFSERNEQWVSTTLEERAGSTTPEWLVTSGGESRRSRYSGSHTVLGDGLPLQAREGQVHLGCHGRPTSLLDQEWRLPNDSQQYTRAGRTCRDC